EFIAGIEAMHSPYYATHHMIGNILIDVQGDRATSECYLTARLWKFQDSGDVTELFASGRYCDRWSCRKGHWAMDHRRMVLDMMYTWVPPRPSTTIPGDRSPAAHDGRRGAAD